MEVRSLCPLVAWGFVWHWNGTTYAQTVVVKATFRLAPDTCPLADTQDPVAEADVYADGDARRSLIVPSDKVPHKPHADVTLVGHAYAPKKLPVRSLLVRLTAGSLNKSIEVWCDRRFRQQDGQLREGPAFSKMPLAWERAAGGPETNNPVGLRFDAEPDAYGLVTFPNLQPPGTHVSQRSDTFATVCFAPVSATWPSRTTRIERVAGKFSPSDWNTRPIPEGFDYAYFQSAPPDQQLTEIRPNERLILENLHPDHPRLVTSLPNVQPRVIAERESGEREVVKLVADTLRIDTDRGVCVVVWRGTLWLRSASEAGRILVMADGVGIEELDESDMLSTSHPTAELALDPDDATGTPNNETIAPWFDTSNGPAAVMPFLSPAKPQGPQPAKPSEPKVAAAPAPSAPKLENLPANAAAAMSNATLAPWDDDSNAPGPVMPFLGQDKPPAAPAPKPSEPKVAAAPLPFAKPVAFGKDPAGEPRPRGFNAAMPVRPADAPPPIQAPPIPAPMKNPASAPVVSPGAAPPLPITPITPITPPAMNVPVVPPPPPVVTPPLVMEPIAPASDPSRWAKSGGPGEEVRLTFGQTAAASFVPSAAVEQPVVKQAPAPKKPSKEPIEVLHVEADSMYRLKANAAWKKLLVETRPKNSREPDEDIPQEIRTEQRNLRDVTVIMTRAEVLDDQGIRRAFSGSVSEDGVFTAPVVLIEGDFRWSFEEVETLRVTAGLAGPLATTNKKVKDLVDIADDMLGKPIVFKGPAANLTAKIREQFGASSVVAQNEANVVIDQTLLERQAYQKRQFFDKKWLRGTLKVGGASMTAYLPEAVLGNMPAFNELRIKVVAELKPKMTADDGADFSVFVFAIARGLGSSSQWSR